MNLGSINIEHIGIAVDDIDAMKALLEALFGAAPYKEEAVESEGVRTHFYEAGGTKIELLEATSPDSPIARHIEKRGPGLHHLAFAVDDAERAIDVARNAGLRVLSDAPKPGADGKMIVFVHPKDTGGVLMEFCSNRSNGDAAP